ncbi:MAG: hypothetical protein LBK02_04305, partial [Treponema sp.]|nr:hypothetical protein [Treponema sp.]
AADAAKLAGGSRDRAIAGAFGAMLLAGAKQRAGEIAAGTKGKLADKDGYPAISRVGSGNSIKNQNANGTQSFSDAEQASRDFTKNRIGQQKAQAEKNAPQPPQNPGSPSSGEAKRLNNEGQNPRPPRSGRGGPPEGGGSSSAGRGNSSGPSPSGGK